MVGRRKFLGAVALQAAAGSAVSRAAETDREYWVRTLVKLADPVLTNLAAGTLKRNMPVECVAGTEADRRKYTYLEALGRLLAGMAPWLEAALPAGAERELQQKYAGLAREAIRSAVNPASPDYLNFSEGAQPLVDCGFLGQALLRAPNELWKKLDAATRKQLTAALVSSRKITPGFNNWLLFAAMVEAALALMGEGEPGEAWDAMRIDYAIRQHQHWYVGDGAYQDGPEFHWDYYNSYVIQPMLVDILRTMEAHSKSFGKFLPDTMKRARRYAAVQERLISPEGTYPALGRSITYRTGAFQVLAQMALLGELPSPLRPAGVRSALTAVMRKSLEAPGTFDNNGWLRIGFCGHQPHMGETYISTGSLYLCSAVMLPLGLSPADPFWSGGEEKWTSAKLAAGVDPAGPDHAL